jgi:hypothetical protein
VPPLNNLRIALAQAVRVERVSVVAAIRIDFIAAAGNKIARILRISTARNSLELSTEPVFGTA